MRITGRQLRKLIREALGDGSNPRLRYDDDTTPIGFDAARAAGDAALEQDDLNYLTSELRKTYSWFETVVFPALRGDTSWPIVVDRDYLVGFHVTLEALPLNGGRSYDFIALIPVGTRIMSPDSSFKLGGKMFPDMAPLPSTATMKTVNLKTCHDNLEKLVRMYDLDVPMQSFDRF